MDDGVAIDVVDAGHDALLELVFRCHPDVTQDGAGEFGEEALNEVEPGAVPGRERKFEAACGSCVEPGSGFSRDVCGMIVEDQLDRRAGRIGRVEKLEEFDELAAAVAVSDKSVDLPRQQIDPRQQAERAMASVLKIARKGRMDAWHGRQIRRRRRDGLNPRLFIVGDDRHRLARFLRPGSLRLDCGLLQDLDLAIDTQDLRHFLLEVGVATLQIVAHLVRLDLLLAENLAHRALDQMGETVMSGLWSVNVSISSSVIANSTACRHVAMIPILVQTNSNEESTNTLPVPWTPVSWNRWSRTAARIRTRSAASAGRASLRPFAQRYSIATFRDSKYPVVFNPSRNESSRSANKSGVSLPRKPT